MSSTATIRKIKTLTRHLWIRCYIYTVIKVLKKMVLQGDARIFPRAEYSAGQPRQRVVASRAEYSAIYDICAVACGLFRLRTEMKNKVNQMNNKRW